MKNLLRFSLFLILPVSPIFAQRPTPGELADANKASAAALELFRQGKYQEALISGPRSLLQVSERAAYAAKFTPTKLSGQAKQVYGTLTYNFVHR